MPQPVTEASISIKVVETKRRRMSFTLRHLLTTLQSIRHTQTTFSQGRHSTQVPQAIADLAFERGAPIEVDEFRTLNRCLDNGIADAVTEYAFQRNSLVESNSLKALNGRLGFLAHELRNLIHTATLAVMAIKAGNVGATGATGALLDRSLIGMRNLIDRSLADVRITAGMPPRAQLISPPISSPT